MFINNMESPTTGMPIILIAEDNLSNYLLFEYLLKKDFQLFHASNGREAVEFFKIYRPQLILMDIKMPEMDGFEATAEIRKYSTLIPIIAVTAYAFSDDKNKILRSGFNAYLSKPIDATELKKTILHFLS